SSLRPHDRYCHAVGQPAYAGHGHLLLRFEPGALNRNEAVGQVLRNLDGSLPGDAPFDDVEARYASEGRNRVLRNHLRSLFRADLQLHAGEDARLEEPFMIVDARLNTERPSLRIYGGADSAQLAGKRLSREGLYVGGNRIGY